MMATAAQVWDCAEAGDLEGLQRLSELVADEDRWRELLSAKDEDGYTAMHKAACYGQGNILLYLIARSTRCMAHYEVIVFSGFLALSRFEM